MFTYPLWVLLLFASGLDDPNAREPTTGNTPIHRAVLQNRPDVLQSLVTRGGDPNLANVVGVTPLMMAASLGYERIFTDLLRYDADPLAVDVQGWTVLRYAHAGGKPNIIQLTRERGMTRLHIFGKEAFFHRGKQIFPESLVCAERLEALAKVWNFSVHPERIRLAASDASGEALKRCQSAGYRCEVSSRYEFREIVESAGTTFFSRKPCFAKGVTIDIEAVGYDP